MSNDPVLIGMLEMTYNYKSDFKVWWQGGPLSHAEGGEPRRQGFDGSFGR